MYKYLRSRHVNSNNKAQNIQYSIYKKMTADEKIRIATGLYYMARKIKRAALKNQFPDVPDAEIEKKLRDIFLHART